MESHVKPKICLKLLNSRLISSWLNAKKKKKYLAESKAEKMIILPHNPQVFGQRLLIESDQPGILLSLQSCLTFQSGHFSWYAGTSWQSEDEMKIKSLLNAAVQQLCILKYRSKLSLVNCFSQHSIALKPLLFVHYDQKKIAIHIIR